MREGSKKRTWRVYSLFVAPDTPDLPASGDLKVFTPEAPHAFSRAVECADENHHSQVRASYLRCRLLGRTGYSTPVPQLSAQQMPTAQHWEGVCHDLQALSGSISVSTEVATRLVREMGAQGWEPSVSMGVHMCFKRPL